MGFLVLFFILIVSALTFMHWKFASEIDEWRNTKKPFLWTFAWGTILSVIIPIFIVLYNFIGPIVAREGNPPDFWVASLATVPYLLLVILAYTLCIRRLKKKYKIVFEHEKEKIRKRFQNDPEFREQWLREKQKGDLGISQDEDTV